MIIEILHYQKSIEPPEIKKKHKEIVILFSNFPVQFYEILQMPFTGSLFQTESLKFSHTTLVHYGHHLEKENPKS